MKQPLHIALLGDSIFDNGAYTSGGPDVVAHLNRALPGGSQATLCAVDGATCDDVHAQIARVPSDATHLLLSAGGNDALMASPVLMQPASLVAEALFTLADVAQAFEARYSRLLDALVATGLPLTVCTIYNPRFTDPLQQRVTVAALCHFNDVIVRQAREHGVPLLDLRPLCTTDEDYGNEIEPSSQGGAHIAAAIAQLVSTHDFATRHTVLYPLPG